MAKTQASVVLAHLRKHGSITSMEAFELYGVTRLSAVVFNLRAAGHSIESVTEHTTNRYGRRVAYSRYELEDSDED